MILIIEDDEATLYALAHRLSYGGYLPLPTTCGEEALELLSQPTTPRAIVLDWRLPRGMDGPDVLHRIRSDRRLAEVPVLIYSAYLDDEVNKRAMAVGATECVAKGERGGTEMLLKTLARYAPPQRTGRA
jgi:CheY-like chemotaxis protein